MIALLNILVGQEQQHGTPLRLTRGEPAPNVAKVPLVALDAPADVCRQLFALVKVRLDFLPMTEVVPDDCVERRTTRRVSYCWTIISGVAPS